MKHVANIITVSRLIGTAILFVLYLEAGTVTLSFFLLFLWTTVSDLADGYFARKYETVSNFGKIADPIADKLLSFLVFFVVYDLGFLHWAALVYIVAKEVGVTVYRLKKASEGVILSAFKFGKVKTAFNFLAFVVFFLTIMLVDSGIVPEVPLLIKILVWLAVI